MIIIIIFASEAEHTPSAHATRHATHPAPRPCQPGGKIAVGGGHLWPTMRTAPKGPAAGLDYTDQWCGPLSFYKKHLQKPFIAIKLPFHHSPYVFLMRHREPDLGLSSSVFCQWKRMGNKIKGLCVYIFCPSKNQKAFSIIFSKCNTVMAFFFLKRIYYYPSLVFVEQ